MDHLFRCTRTTDEVWHIQKVWDRLVIINQLAKISSQLSSEVDKASILSASSPHSSGWLMAPPIMSIGLRLSDEMIRLAIGFTLGFRTCEPHTCPCGKEVNARGLYGLSCRHNSARQQRHVALTTSFGDQLNELNNPSPRNQQVYQEQTANVQTKPHKFHGHMINH